MKFRTGQKPVYPSYASRKRKPMFKFSDVTYSTKEEYVREFERLNHLIPTIGDLK
jgi:hypothetical protein